MNNFRTLALILNGVFLGGVLLVFLDGRPTSAAPCVGGPAVCGQNSGLVPFHKDAIGATLLWERREINPNTRTTRALCRRPTAQSC